MARTPMWPAPIFYFDRIYLYASVFVVHDVHTESLGGSGWKESWLLCVRIQ